MVASETLPGVKDLIGKERTAMLAVLVSGASGFVGSRLVVSLVQRGDSVTVLLREGRSTNPNATEERGDIT